MQKFIRGTEVGSHLAPADTSRNSALASRSRRVKRLAYGVKWVADDKARLRDLVGRIRHWNEGSADLLPEVTASRQRSAAPPIIRRANSNTSSAPLSTTTRSYGRAPLSGA